MYRQAMDAYLSAGHYFGVKRSQVRLGDLILSESVYASHMRLPKHSHENAYMIMVLERTQEEELNGSLPRSYQRHAMALHPADEMHSQKIGAAGLRCLHVEFGANWLKDNRHVWRAR
jgi:hypothetical protein